MRVFFFFHSKQRPQMFVISFCLRWKRSISVIYIENGFFSAFFQRHYGHSKWNVKQSIFVEMNEFPATRILFGRFHWANTIPVCKFLYNATSFGAHVHIFMTAVKLCKQWNKQTKSFNLIHRVLIISLVNEYLLCAKKSFFFLLTKEIVCARIFLNIGKQVLLPSVLLFTRRNKKEKKKQAKYIDLTFNEYVIQRRAIKSIFILHHFGMKYFMHSFFSLSFNLIFFIVNCLLIQVHQCKRNQWNLAAIFILNCANIYHIWLSVCRMQCYRFAF